MSGALTGALASGLLAAAQRPATSVSILTSASGWFIATIWLVAISSYRQAGEALSRLPVAANTGSATSSGGLRVALM
jgi:hypothetical protein